MGQACRFSISISWAHSGQFSWRPFVSIVLCEQSAGVAGFAARSSWRVLLVLLVCSACVLSLPLASGVLTARSITALCVIKSVCARRRLCCPFSRASCTAMMLGFQHAASLVHLQYRRVQSPCFLGRTQTPHYYQNFFWTNCTAAGDQWPSVARPSIDCR